MNLSQSAPYWESHLERARHPRIPPPDVLLVKTNYNEFNPERISLNGLVNGAFGNVQPTSSVDKIVGRAPPLYPTSI